MPGETKLSHALLLVRALRPGVADGRSAEVVGMVRQLDLAEAAAKLKPGARRRLYQVSYRVKDVESQGRGEAGLRRAVLVELIRSRKPSEVHASTSNWLLRSHLMADTLSQMLAAPLDLAVDFISVAQVGENRAKLGDADLQS